LIDQDVAAAAAWTDGDSGRIRLVFEDEFLAGAIHETLRLHTLVPDLWRRAEEDIALVPTATRRRSRGRQQKEKRVWMS
jgi:cytochrome P450